MEQIYIYLFVMSAVTIAIRLVPLTLIRGQVKNRFVRSFLYYVPYVTLAVMTFPAILTATQTPVSGALAFVIGIALAWYGASLFKVSAACCLIVFAVELVLC
ncbi:AzlD domain-containing protein [Selenomonas sp.]|uniref:AzlD domain-containing protein n=1 Tax=Selenomonas sp. TaxID=2053611 RepID=UPI0025F81E96|nr:AzlD domain-containing protein [Selenomonas sp.]MCI6086726.1 AzlD domain-containing protein [Selenomonas sp.]MDY3296866.1 AzlD domain-containing protein [Selenomonas sp.]MDY4416872.1 AzlD domain-containing protein [Selenomonas sp.]